MTRSKSSSKSSSKTTRKRTARTRRRANSSQLLAILAIVVVAVAAYVYFNRYPEQAGSLLREVFGVSGTPTVQTQPTIAPARDPAAPGTLPPGYPQLPAGLQVGQVTDVVDGDTLDVDIGGEQVRLRLIGIDTPESVDPRRPVECYGVEASNKANELLGGQMVYLEPDPSQDERDRFGRLLRFVWLADGRLFNLEMIAQGYAYEYTYDAKYKYQAEFRAAQAQAQTQQLGLWSPTTCNGEQGRPAQP
jgi:micrococcal nuclease